MLEFQNTKIFLLKNKLKIGQKKFNTKIFLLKNKLKIGQKKFLLLVKLKIQFRGHT